MALSYKYREITRIVQEEAIIKNLVEQSFKKIAPSWPLKNLIAVNPLQGFEELPIEEALRQGSAYFEKSNLPQEMLLVNIETIKWLGLYFDEGQATISMPLREHGFYSAWRLLAPYDKKLHKNIKEKINFLKNLPIEPDQVITECLFRLNIAVEDTVEFITLLLTTLPGWSSYIKYKTEWSSVCSNYSNITQLEYLAVRIVITSLLWQEAKLLLDFHKENLKNSSSSLLEKIEATEYSYRIPLLKKIALQKIKEPHVPKAQFVFCIDVRSERFRKCLEGIGDYQTLGFAGFFGIPVQITNSITDDSHASCPVLLKPKHDILEYPHSQDEGLKYEKKYKSRRFFKKLYQSLKYNFTTPFALVETLGGFSGVWMAVRTLFPRLACKIHSALADDIGFRLSMEPSIDNMTLKEKCNYAENALKMMGLTHSFAPIIIFCGHGSSTQNNAYATALDCGACGGRHGGNNARILAAIMNCPEVKAQLFISGIIIPETTKFFAAEHNTTTDEVILFCKSETKAIATLKQDIARARKMNSLMRLQKLNEKMYKLTSAVSRSSDWAQVRPEWGLARNSAFIIAPRDITSSLELDGRCFLHSYDYKQDPQGVFLTTILTAPMVVAQWINMQYLFSTVNNVAYGGGSKITNNVIGKIGIVQGNSSDLMNGLPLQSVCSTDRELYHEPQRLLVVVLAPQLLLDSIIQSQSVLQKLFGNGWVKLARLDPDSNKIYLLNRDFSWQELN